MTHPPDFITLCRDAKEIYSGACNPRAILRTLAAGLATVKQCAHSTFAAGQLADIVQVAGWAVLLCDQECAVYNHNVPEKLPVTRAIIGLLMHRLSNGDFRNMDMLAPIRLILAHLTFLCRDGIGSYYRVDADNKIIEEVLSKRHG